MKPPTPTLRALAVLLLILDCSLYPSDAYLTKEYQLSSFRLPKRIKPQHYDLFIKPDFQLVQFEGNVKIDFEVIDDPACNQRLATIKVFGCDKNEIILHADEKLRIFGASLSLLADGSGGGGGGDDAASESVPIYEVSRDKKNEFLIIKLNRKLQTGARGQLEIKYKSPFRGVPFGFYLNEFVDVAQNETREYASTLFEPAHARKAFPCFDEPQLKATFDLAIEHDSKLNTLANMEPVKQEQLYHEEDDGGGDDNDTARAAPQPTGFTRTQFARTPPMSTYLLAFAVGEFEQLAGQVLDGKLKINVNTPRGLGTKARVALDVARRSYVSLLDYFAIDQPLRKIDLLSVKYHFGGGAMENWGLVTFYEHCLLDDERTTTPEMKAFAALAVVHELAHHWFGNLVTMRWWDDLWLNEGFATWLSYEKANEILPELHFDIYYLQDSHIVGLEHDAVKKSHPIRQANLRTPAEIQASFDRITYAKGSAVVRMLDDYLGKENFKLALRDYLRRHSYQNTNADDLWAALRDKTGLPVVGLMKSWLDQPGFPLISVELVAAGDGTNGKILVKQERFFNDSRDASEIGTQQQRWMVPISILLVSSDPADGGDSTPTSPASKVLKFVLEESMDQMEIPLPSWFSVNQSGSWLKLNAQFEGFYRVQYSSELLEKLKEPIERRTMTPIDRINVLDDSVALFKSGKMGSKQLDDVLSWFRDEEDPGVMFSLAKTVEQLYDLVETRGERHLLLVEHYERINRFDLDPADGFLETRAKGRLLFALVHCNYEPTIRDALQLFDAKTNLGEEQISPIIREAVFAAVVKFGSDEQLAKLKSIFDSFEDEREKKRLIIKLFKSVAKDRAAKVIGDEGNGSRQTETEKPV